MKIDLKLAITVFMIIITVVIAQVRENLTKEQRLEKVEEIVIRYDAYLQQQQKQTIIDSVMTDSMLKFIQQQVAINQRLLED